MTDYSAAMSTEIPFVSYPAIVVRRLATSALSAPIFEIDCCARSPWDRVYCFVDASRPGEIRGSDWAEMGRGRYCLSLLSATAREIQREERGLMEAECVARDSEWNARIALAEAICS